MQRLNLESSTHPITLPVIASRLITRLNSFNETIPLWFYFWWGGCQMQPQWIEGSFLGCWWWHFVVSAVRVKLNRWGHSCLGLLSVSRDIRTSSTASSPSSSNQPPPKNPETTPHPLCVTGLMRNCPSSSVYPLSLNTPFWRAGFYLYLAGDWQLTFCTGGNFWEWGQYLWVSCMNPTFWEFLYTSMYPLSIYLSDYLSIYLSGQRSSATRRFVFSPISFSLVLFSGRIIGQASTSFHFQPQQTERLH